MSVYAHSHAYIQFALPLPPSPAPPSRTAAEDVDYSRDPADWKALSGEERRSVESALVYQLAADALLLEGLTLRFLVDVEQPEVGGRWRVIVGSGQAVAGAWAPAGRGGAKQSRRRSLLVLRQAPLLSASGVQRPVFGLLGALTPAALLLLLPPALHIPKFLQ